MPASDVSCTFPPWMTIFVPVISSFGRVRISTFEMAVIEARASPLNPIVETVSRSSIRVSLLVACFLYERRASALLIPQPLSRIRMECFPPVSTSMRISVAPASIELSTSSFTTDAGRSITSPAAILFIVSLSRIRILFPCSSIFSSIFFSTCPVTCFSLFLLLPFIYFLFTFYRPFICSSLISYFLIP